MSVLSVTIVKQGEQDLPGLTDTTVPKRLGPKRANNIRKFFVRALLNSLSGHLEQGTDGRFIIPRIGICFTIDKQHISHCQQPHQLPDIDFNHHGTLFHSSDTFLRH
jgi:hypothetical protein